MVDLHTLCMGCMGNNEGRDVCPHCGYEEAMRPQPEDCLPLRTLLQNRYIVGRLLERNGEGIGYIDMTPCPTALFISGSLCRTACAEEIQRQAFCKSSLAAKSLSRKRKLSF